MLGGFRQHLLVHVAERDDFDRRDLDQPEQIDLAVPSAADQADSSGLVIRVRRMGPCCS